MDCLAGRHRSGGRPDPIQPTQPIQPQRRQFPIGIRAAQTTKAPVPTVLPAASPASTLVPATAAEQAAFKAGQRSCQKSPATTLAPAGAAEHAAFEAGYQWCHLLSTVGHHGSGTKR